MNNSLLFKAGRGFYEFTKPEIISHKKEVVLIEKETGDMFTGKLFSFTIFDLNMVGMSKEKLFDM